MANNAKQQVDPVVARLDHPEGLAVVLPNRFEISPEGLPACFYQGEQISEGEEGRELYGVCLTPAQALEVAIDLQRAAKEGACEILIFPASRA